MKYIFSVATIVILFFTDCNNKKLNTIGNFDIELLVGKWKMVEYGGGSVNALDTISFYENGKMDYPFETGEFTYHLIKPDSLIICNKSFREQHYKILKLSNDSLIKQIRRQRIYADSIDEPVNGEIEKYIRITKK